MLRVLVVHSGEPDDGEGSEAEVEDHVEERVVDVGTREEGEAAEHIDGHCFEHVFVEHVADGVRVAPVSLSAVEEEKVAQESELPDGVVGGTHGLLTLEASNTDADVCSCDHVHVVSTIANSQSGLVRVPIAYHMDDFCFLLGTDATSEHDIGTLAQINEFFLDELV